MHELGVVSNVLDVILKRSEELGIARVGEVHIILGEDAGVSEDSFRFHWDLAARGTVAEHAEVTIENQPSGGVRLAWFDVERAEDRALAPASLALSRADNGVASPAAGDDPPHEPHLH